MSKILCACNGTFCSSQKKGRLHGESGKKQSRMKIFQYSCLENPMDGGAWKAAVHGVAEGWTWLSDFTFTFQFHALEKEMATHSSVLAWRVPGTGEPGGLPSVGSHRVGHDWSGLAAAVKAMVFPVVMHGCESWTVKKAERWRVDAFELWCWRRLLRVPWIQPVHPKGD